MFETLSEKLGTVFEGLTRRGALTESDVAEALREVRVALLEADVALPVARDFIAKVKERAVGEHVLRSIKPGQQVVKIVHDTLVETLGSDAEAIDLNAAPPVVILMVGLQGSGKTTTTAKIARRLTDRQKKKVLMASLDTRRPAAQEQLKVLGEQTGVATLPIVAGQGPVEIAKRAMRAAELSGADVLMLDTAGRLHIDEALMAEVAAVRDATDPHETLLVVDSLTGQDAVNVADTFARRVGITGSVLTRIDGDGRGGAALSMRAVTGRPIKLIGTGEKLDALEDFDPARIAGRILGMGDIVSLVEKAAETIDQEKAAKIARKMKKGEFDLDDLAEQFSQMRRMGGLQSMLSLIPGVGKMGKEIANSGLDDKSFRRQEAIISSMTRDERRNPKILNASRKRRVAAGSGTEVQEINRLLKMHRQLADAMKAMGKGGMKGMLGALGGGAMPPGALKGLPPEMLRGAPPGGGLSGLPGLGGPGLPGLPSGKKGKP
ncbi:MAG: signal recognition particle protein [Alphaproteobacteria bacterium]|nr:signal recognition particle protein [Alphaproteobacteria bacterium]